MNNWFFGIVTIFIFAFVGYYLSTPFTSKNISQNQTNQEAAYLQKLNEQSKTLPDIQKPPQEKPFIAQYERKKITPEEPISITIPYYSKPTVRNIKFLQAEINGILTEIVLDTGASTIVLNENTVRQLQINQFGKPYTVSTAAGHAIAYPFIAKSMKLGNIEIHDIECAYTPSLKDNLLGGTFLKNFEYTISEQKQTIVFTPINNTVVLTPTNTNNNNPYGQSQAGWIEVDGKKRYILSNGQIRE
jgi:clan AA aspartic protease (TIGR02281 family)